MRAQLKCAGVILLAAAQGCGGGPVSPEDILKELTEQLETQSIVFRFSVGDSVDADWQQSYHDWITILLGVQLPTKLTYNKYTGRAQMQRVTGMTTNGFAEPSIQTVHSIFSRDGHEAAHVYSALVGRPSDFFNEGFAVALNTEPGVVPWTPHWNGTHVYAHTQLLIRTNQLRPLAPMLTTGAFRNVDELIGLGEAGSFTLFMIEQHGLGRLLAFFAMGTRDDSRSRIEANFLAAWGISFAVAEAAWLQFIDGWSG